MADNKGIFIRLPEGVKEQVDEEAGRLGLSTNDFIRLLINQYFDDIHFSRRRDREEVAEREQSHG